MSLPFPPRQAVLTTLRGLLRSSNPKISGRRARPQTLASEWTAEVLRYVYCARSLSAPLAMQSRTEPRSLMRHCPAPSHSLYRKHQGCTDAKLAWKMHNMAEDALSMHKSSTEHAECMFDAGWCLGRVRPSPAPRASSFLILPLSAPSSIHPKFTSSALPLPGHPQSNMDQVTKVSRFVGLDMPQLYREGADADADAAAEAANGSEDPFFEALGHDAGALGGVTEVKAAQPESRPQG